MNRILATVLLAVVLVLVAPPEAAPSVSPSSESQTAEYSPKTIAATATLIFSNQNARAFKVMVRNTSSVDLYVGRSNATTSSASFKISAGDAASFVVPAADSFYGVIASGTAVVYYAASIY